MFFFTKLPTVIGPKHYNRIIGIGASLQCVKHSPKHRIRKMNRGQIALYPFLPFSFLLNMSKVAIARNRSASFGNIVEVILFISGWKLNRFERKGFKVFFGHKPWFVWSIESASQKEWLRVFLMELFTDPFANGPVASELFVGYIQCSPVRFNILPWSASL